MHPLNPRSSKVIPYYCTGEVKQKKLPALNICFWYPGSAWNGLVTLVLVVNVVNVGLWSLYLWKKGSNWVSLIEHNGWCRPTGKHKSFHPFLILHPTSNMCIIFLVLYRMNNDWRPTGIQNSGDASSLICYRHTAVFFVGTNTADIDTDSRRIDKAKQDKNLGTF